MCIAVCYRRSRLRYCINGDVKESLTSEQRSARGGVRKTIPKVIDQGQEIEKVWEKPSKCLPQPIISGVGKEEETSLQNAPVTQGLSRGNIISSVPCCE